MNFDSLFRTFLERPIYQRLFMAFTVGLFLSCAARVSEAQPRPATPSAAAATHDVTPPPAASTPTAGPGEGGSPAA
jgi:hypothetical protein